MEKLSRRRCPSNSPKPPFAVVLAAEAFLSDFTISLTNQVSISIRHSTLLLSLQNGQEKTISSLSIRFLVGGLAAAFLFPLPHGSTSLLPFKTLERGSEGGDPVAGPRLGRRGDRSSRTSRGSKKRNDDGIGAQEARRRGSESKS